MDLNENGSLLAVEKLLEEFFSPYTSNGRKHDIEAQLNSFKTTPHLCGLCLYFISHTSSQYVTMFALQTLESVIKLNWNNTDWPTQEEIKSTLQTNLIFKSHNTPHFLKHKYAKLLVEIAKYDWPTKYPEFFVNILELLKSTEQNQLIGLIMLRTACEEIIGFNTTFENCPRKKELTRLLHGYIPGVFMLLTNILEKFGTNSRHAATATPPPSPTHPTTSPSLEQQLATATFRPDVKALSQEVLNTVQFMFAWVPIESVPARIIRAIFCFTNVSTYSQDDDDLCVCAMSTINEIFYRKCSPPGSETFFKEIYDHVIELLRNLANSCSYRIDSYDETFVKKLCELLVLIIEQHLWRYEKDPTFSSLEFLSLFFQYTMHLPSVPCYLRCLTVWTAFFKQIKPENAQKYSEVFLGLGSALIKKIQFTYNCAQLIEINTTEPDEDDKTDWQRFLDASIDIISRAAHYAFLDLFNQALNGWNACNAVYRQLENAADARTRALNFETSETEQLYYILRDFSTTCFTLGSLAHHFYTTDDEQLQRTAASTVYILIDHILQSASKSATVRYYELKVADARLTQCFVDAHSELLASLKTWLGWIEGGKNHVTAGHDVILDAVLPLLEDGARVPVKIGRSAAHLLLEIARKPNAVAGHPGVARFIRAAPNLRYADRDTGNTVCSVVCEVLLKPLKSTDKVGIEAKRAVIAAFFNDFTGDFRLLTPTTPENRLGDVVRRLLPSLAHVVEYCRGFSVAAKGELTCALGPTLDHALSLFPTYVKYATVHEEFSHFFIAALKNLQAQIGLEFTKNAIQVFLQVAISEQHSNNFGGLQRLLDIFCIVVREPSSKAFLPDILHLCMENIYPLLLPRSIEYPDVFVSFLDLLYSILNFRWLYFYNSQVMAGYSPVGDETAGPDSPKRPEQLLAMLKVFCEALLHEDVNIFRRSLVILQDLNHNKQLFHKAIFRSTLLPELLRVLLNALLYKRHGLSCEEIGLVVYSMAEVSFEGFFTKFLPQYIQDLKELLPQQYELLLANFNPTNDRDVPSFVQHLQSFSNDFDRCRVSNLGSPSVL
ncbi:exportin-6-B [Cylas formicarius]|uniref:exportin-6-B n=1 Tax=Cylas formicarius TaxID=197179 RepID=UPI002958BC3D|nr:exportin-6-B [Cylas formicarius]